MCAIDPWSQGLGGSGLALRDFQEGMGIRNMGRFVEGVGNLVRRDAIDGILRWWYDEVELEVTALRYQPNWYSASVSLSLPAY